MFKKKKTTKKQTKQNKNKIIYIHIYMRTIFWLHFIQQAEKKRKWQIGFDRFGILNSS